VLEQLAAYPGASGLAAKDPDGLVYPAILMLASVVIVGFLLGYVVPDVVKIFVDSGQALPWLTRALISASEGLRSHGLMLLGVIAMVVGVWRWSLRQPTWQLRWHR
jgi:general secretion pathway protein F